MHSFSPSLAPSIPYLAVLICLGTIESLAIDHRHGHLGPLLHALQVTQGRPRPDKCTRDGIVITGDGADDDAPGVLGLLQVLDQERNQQEMRQVVNLQRLLNSVGSEGRGGKSREVHSSIADQGVQGLATLNGFHVLGELADGIEGGQVEGADGEQGGVQVQFFRHTLHLGHVSHATDNKIVATGAQGLESALPEAGGGAGEHDGLFVAGFACSLVLGRKERVKKVGGKYSCVLSRPGRGRDRRGGAREKGGGLGCGGGHGGAGQGAG